MDRPISEWRREVSYEDEQLELGLAADLFDAAVAGFAELLRILLEDPARLDKNSSSYEALRNEFQRFYLWNDGFSTSSGGLDRILSCSKNLRATVLALMVQWAKTVRRIPQVLTDYDFSKADSKINKLEAITEKVDQVAEATAEDVKIQYALRGSDDHSALDTDSDSSTLMSDGGFEDIVEDLKVCNDGLLDLTLSLEAPANDSIAFDDGKLIPLDDLSGVTESARPFVLIIKDRYPSTPVNLVKKLGEANWQRRERLREKRVAAQAKRRTFPSDNDSLIVSKSVIHSKQHQVCTSQSPRASIIQSSVGFTSNYQSNTSVSGFSDPSIFDHDAVQFPTTRNNRAVAESVTSFATSVANEAEGGQRRVPNLPDEHDFESAFECKICGDVLRDIRNVIDWKRHVYNDLKPYVCLFTDCNLGLHTFMSQREWMNHEFQNHRTETQWRCNLCVEGFSTAALLRAHINDSHREDFELSQIDEVIVASKRLGARQIITDLCPFCQTVPSGTQKGYAKHVGKHLKEISLAALPRWDSHSEDESSNSSNGGDEENSDSDGDGGTKYREDSKSLGSNPSVNTLKKFVQLLNDNNFDFDEEIEFERLRKTVVQQIRLNEIAEQYIEQLDFRIALLVKNEITFDDVIRHQKNFAGHAGTLARNASISSGKQLDMKAFNKESQKKLESYQQLIFILQTQPQYLARLFTRIRERGIAEHECKRIEKLMMRLFGYAQSKREEYYMLKLLARSIKEEIGRCSSLQDFNRGKFFWSKLLAHYIRSPRERMFMRDLLGPLIRDYITENPALDLESDPKKIYYSVINSEELRTGQPSRRSLDIPIETIIKDKEVRELFIYHLRDNREISDYFLVRLEDLLYKMPYGIRFISKQIFHSFIERFPQEEEQHILQIISNWVWCFYLQPALTNPSRFGVIEKELSPLQKRNLSEVAKVLHQVALGKFFGDENIYLQPLNPYVDKAIKRLEHIVSNMVSVPDIESAFDIFEFDEYNSEAKPTLCIKMTDIFAIHRLVSDEPSQMCPDKNDIFREILQELGSAENNESIMVGAPLAEIQMILSPGSHKIKDPEDSVNSLLTETKRCILYIIRVQAGRNLVEVLTRPVTHEEDGKWQTLLRTEFGPSGKTRGAYSNANNMIDIATLSFAELKRTALENILKLESAGKISRHDDYQDILSAIALDIRLKRRRRVRRQHELQNIRLTLASLEEEGLFMEMQRKSYDSYIEKAMMTLQNKKGKTRFLLPFTQGDHERVPAPSGRKPKLGSLKYSALSLADKGILISWKGPTEPWDSINISISCTEAGTFLIEGSTGSTPIPGASARVSLDECRSAQSNNHRYIDLFEDSLRLNLNLFLHLIYREFYAAEPTPASPVGIMGTDH